MRVVEPVTAHERTAGSARVLRVDTYEPHPASVVTGEPGQHRRFLLAGGTPGRPDVDEQRLTSERAELESRRGWDQRLPDEARQRPALRFGDQSDASFARGLRSGAGRTKEEEGEEADGSEADEHADQAGPCTACHRTDRSFRRGCCPRSGTTSGSSVSILSCRLAAIWYRAQSRPINRRTRTAATSTITAAHM